MSSPFPGMNPYLENPEFWPEFHHRLITAIAIAIAPHIRPKYLVAIEKRIYLSEGEESVLVGIPDVAISSGRAATSQFQSTTATLPTHYEPVKVIVPMPEEVREGYLEIREAGTGEVITVLEVLSPKNKRTGEGRSAYERKRRHVLASASHLVEIDLLRGGKPMPILDNALKRDYRILISRGDRRPNAHLYAFNLRDEIPPFPLPLALKDAEPKVDLQTLLGEVYEQAGYNLRLDYSQPPQPPLKNEDAAWAEGLFKAES